MIREAIVQMITANLGTESFLSLRNDVRERRNALSRAHALLKELEEVDPCVGRSIQADLVRRDGNWWLRLTKVQPKFQNRSWIKEDGQIRPLGDNPHEKDKK